MGQQLGSRRVAGKLPLIPYRTQVTSVLIVDVYILWSELCCPAAAAADCRAAADREVTVWFNADVAEDMPWEFIPTQVGWGWCERVGGRGNRCLGRVGGGVKGREVVGGGLALEVYSNAGRFRRLGRVRGGAGARDVVGARKDVLGAPYPGHSHARELICNQCLCAWWALPSAMLKDRSRV